MRLWRLLAALRVRRRRRRDRGAARRHGHRPLVPRQAAQHRRAWSSALAGASRSTPDAAAPRQAPRLLRRADRAACCQRPTASADAASATCAASGASCRSTRWSTPAPPSSRPRRRTSTAPTSRRTRPRRCPARRRSCSARGPIRIGQGIEFDYCSVHAAQALRAAGVTQHHDQLQPRDGQHRLRHVRPALLRAARRGERAARFWRTRARRAGESERWTNAVRRVLPPVVAQFGGQTAINLAEPLDRAGAPILGTSASTASTWPRIAGASTRCWNSSASRSRPARPCAPSTRRSRRPQRDRLSGAGAPVLRARRARDGDRPHAGDAGALCRARRGAVRRAPGPDRQVPRRARGRGRRDLRRRRTC